MAVCAVKCSIPTMTNTMKLISDKQIILSHFGVPVVLTTAVQVYYDLSPFAGAPC